MAGEGEPFPLRLRMAFQPIVDVEAGRVFAWEALVRGPGGEGAGWVLAQTTDAGGYSFNRECRVTAIREAARLGLARTGALLSINFLPNAVYEPRNCLRTALRAAERTGLDGVVELLADLLERHDRRASQAAP